MKDCFVRDGKGIDHSKQAGPGRGAPPGNNVLFNLEALLKLHLVTSVTPEGFQQRDVIAY